MALVLAGDIGGTRTRLGLFTLKNGKLIRVAYAKYDSKKFKSLEKIVLNFIKALDVHPDTACFAVAGPVMRGVAKITHLPWTVHAKKLSKATKIRHLKLVNDFEALAHSIPLLQKKDFVKIKQGAVEKKGTIALLGAGTGLGEALLVWNGGRYVAVPSEGAHVDFSPTTEFGWRLRNYLAKKHGYCQWGTVLSGSGLQGIYHFLSGKKAEPEAITASQEKLARNAVDVFVHYYGSEAGNLALKAKATGGVYIAGGIAPKIIKQLKSKVFAKAFTTKPRMDHLLKKIPIFVVKNEQAGLLGAARIALMI